MAKFMRTIRDAREELSEEIRSTSPLLTDSYTSGNIRDIESNLGEGMPDQDMLEDKMEIEDVKIKDKKENEKGKPNSCGCH